MGDHIDILLQSRDLPLWASNINKEVDFSGSFICRVQFGQVEDFHGANENLRIDVSHQLFTDWDQNVPVTCPGFHLLEAWWVHWLEMEGCFLELLDFGYIFNRDPHCDIYLVCEQDNPNLDGQRPSKWSEGPGFHLIKCLSADADKLLGHLWHRW